MTSPFDQPTTAPMASTASTAGSIIAGSPDMMKDASTADTEMRLATDRSIEATRMAKVWPMAVMPSAIERPRMPMRFSKRQILRLAGCDRDGGIDAERRSQQDQRGDALQAQRAGRRAGKRGR